MLARRARGSADSPGGFARQVGTDVDLKDVLYAIRRGWWWLLGGTLLGLTVSAGLTWVATPLYSSSTEVFVSSTDRPDTESAYQGDLYSQERASSFVKTMGSEQLAGRVVDELGLDMTASAVARQVTAKAVPKTAIIEVTVTDSSAARARDIAAALGRQFTRWVEDAETPAGAVTSRAVVTTVQAAGLPTRPVSPDLGLALGLGGSLGFLLGLGLTVGSGRSGNNVTTEDDVRHATGAPLIGAVPELSPSGPEGSAASATAPFAQALRGIRTNIQLLGDGRRPRVIVVTGAVATDGASTLAFYLADSLALAGLRVALVEADLRDARPGHVGVGLADVLLGHASLSEATRDRRDGSLAIVGSGGAPEDLSAPLDTAGMRTVLLALRSSRDYVIVAAPAVLSSTDAAVLGALADGCVLTARYGRVGRGQLAEAADVLTRGGSELLGVVLSGVPRSAAVASSAGYRYSADVERGAIVATRRAVMGPLGAATGAIRQTSTSGEGNDGDRGQMHV